MSDSAWRVVDCTNRPVELGYRRGSMVVDHDDGQDLVPLQELAVLLAGANASLSSRLLLKLCECDVVVLHTDWRQVPLGATFGWSDHSRVGARQQGQAGLSVPKRKSAWAALVKAKVLNQAAALDVLGLSGGDGLRVLAGKVRSGDPDNIEAQAAKFYWKMALPSSVSRVAGGGDRVNGFLDYGYTVLRGHTIRAVLAAGLSPSLGFFHRRRDNLFCLADDVIEPFRPLVDVVALSLPEGASLVDSSVKKLLVSAGQRQYSDAGYSGVTCCEELCMRIGRFVEGEESRLRVDPWVVVDAVE